MVRLFCLLRRRPGMTPEEFHAYWRDRHAPLVAATKSGAHVLRYERHPVPLEAYGQPGAPDYDGVTVQWFTSREEFDASLREPDYARIAEDLPRFLDVSALAWVVTDEPEVVIG